MALVHSAILSRKGMPDQAGCAVAGLSSIFDPALANFQDDGYTVGVNAGVASIQLLGAPESG